VFSAHAVSFLPPLALPVCGAVKAWEDFHSTASWLSFERNSINVCFFLKHFSQIESFNWLVSILSQLSSPLFLKRFMP